NCRLPHLHPAFPQRQPHRHRPLQPSRPERHRPSRPTSRPVLSIEALATLLARPLQLRRNCAPSIYPCNSDLYLPLENLAQPVARLTAPAKGFSARCASTDDSPRAVVTPQLSQRFSAG